MARPRSGAFRTYLCPSEYEMEVLRLVAAGSGNRDIASELSISPKTVSVHVFNIPASSASPPQRSRRHRMHVLDGQ